MTARIILLLVILPQSTGIIGMFKGVTGYLSVEVTVTIPLVPPSLSVVMLLIMPLFAFPLSVEVKKTLPLSNTLQQLAEGEIFTYVYTPSLLVEGGKILPRMIGQLLLEEPQILLMVSVHIFLKVIKIKLLVILPLLVVD